MRLFGMSDSVMAGTHNSPGADLCTQVATVWGMIPANRGVGGNTTSQMLARFQADVVALASPGDYVLIEGGINDNSGGLDTVPPDTTGANFLAMAQQAQAASLIPVMMTPNLVASTPYINSFPPYLQAIRYAAFRAKCDLVDVYDWCIETWFIAPGAYDADYINAAPGSGDAQHPNDAGIAMIAKAFGLPQHKRP